MTETYAGWLARTLPELGQRELGSLAAENQWHEDGPWGAFGSAAEYMAAVRRDQDSAARAIADRGEDAEWEAERMARETAAHLAGCSDFRCPRCLAAIEAHMAAQAGVCSHGGHGWDGETCSDIPVQP